MTPFEDTVDHFMEVIFCLKYIPINMKMKGFY